MIELNSDGGRTGTFPTVQWGHGFGPSLRGPPQIIDLYLWAHDEKTTSSLHWLVCSTNSSLFNSNEQWLPQKSLNVLIKCQQLGCIKLCRYFHSVWSSNLEQSTVHVELNFCAGYRCCKDCINLLASISKCEKCLTNSKRLFRHFKITAL